MAGDLPPPHALLHPSLRLGWLGLLWVPPPQATGRALGMAPSKGLIVGLVLSPEINACGAHAYLAQGTSRACSVEQRSPSGEPAIGRAKASGVTRPITIHRYVRSFIWGEGGGTGKGAPSVFVSPGGLPPLSPLLPPLTLSPSSLPYTPLGTPVFMTCGLKGSAKPLAFGKSPPPPQDATTNTANTSQCWCVREQDTEKRSRGFVGHT